MNLNKLKQMNQHYKPILFFKLLVFKAKSCGGGLRSGSRASGPEPCMGQVSEKAKHKHSVSGFFKHSGKGDYYTLEKIQSGNSQFNSKAAPVGKLLESIFEGIMRIKQECPMIRSDKQQYYNHKKVCQAQILWRTEFL